MGKITKWNEISQNQIFLFFFQFRSVESDMWSPHGLVVHMNIFRPKSRRISEVNLKGGWVSCGMKRWFASPALGPLVIFKRTKLLPAIFLCGLSREHTFGDSWYGTDSLQFLHFRFHEFYTEICTRQHTWVTHGVQKTGILNIRQSISNKI